MLGVAGKIVFMDLTLRYLLSLAGDKSTPPNTAPSNPCAENPRAPTLLRHTPVPKTLVLRIRLARYYPGGRLWHCGSECARFEAVHPSVRPSTQIGTRHWPAGTGTMRPMWHHPHGHQIAETWSSTGTGTGIGFLARWKIAQAGSLSLAMSFGVEPTTGHSHFRPTECPRLGQLESVRR